MATKINSSLVDMKANERNQVLASALNGTWGSSKYDSGSAGTQTAYHLGGVYVSMFSLTVDNATVKLPHASVRAKVFVGDSCFDVPSGDSSITVSSTGNVLVIDTL